MTDLRTAAQQALEAMRCAVPTGKITLADWYKSIAALQGALAEPVQEPQCNSHPKAPHGFLRNASHNEDRYVCECEGWDPYEAGYQAGMESAMRMEAESAHILGANPDSSQDTGGLVGCVGHDCGECQARRTQAKRIVTYVCPVCAASLERQE